MNGQRLDDVQGEYTGTGSGNQKVVTLDFRPDFVKIYSPDGHKITMRDGDTKSKLHFVSFSGSMKFGTHSTAIQITDTGFIVTSMYANDMDKTYTFLAYQKKEVF